MSSYKNGFYKLKGRLKNFDVRILNERPVIISFFQFLKIQKFFTPEINTKEWNSSVR